MISWQGRAFQYQEVADAIEAWTDPSFKVDGEHDPIFVVQRDAVGGAMIFLGLPEAAAILPGWTSCDPPDDGEKLR